MYFCKLDSWVNFSFQLLKIQVRRSPLWKIQQHPPLPFGPGRPFFIFRSVPTQLPSSWPLCVGKRTHWNGSKHDPSYRYHLVHLSLHTGDAPSQALLLAFCGKLFPASFRKGNQLGPHFSSKRNDWDRTCFLEHERPPLSSCHRRRHWTLIGCGHPSLLSERERSKNLATVLKRTGYMFLLTVPCRYTCLMGIKASSSMISGTRPWKNYPNSLSIFSLLFYSSISHRLTFLSFQNFLNGGRPIRRFFWFQKVDKLETMR